MPAGPDHATNISGPAAATSSQRDELPDGGALYALNRLTKSPH
jgi:hypothetical protein